MVEAETPTEAQNPPKPLAGGMKTFSCPSCGGTVGIRAVGAAISAVCQSCGTLIDVANDNFRIIKEAAVKIRASDIPLGARGVLMGAEWEAIGYVVRTDGTGAYNWREYLLFNPYQGFRFLVEADGHWNFVTMLRESIEGEDILERAQLGGQDYRVYVRGEAIVEYVMGEFFWRVRVGEKTFVADYIAPPYMLSMEKSQGDIMWSRATYLKPDEVQEAFKLKNIPRCIGIAPNQPSPYAGKSGNIMTLAALFFIALCVVQGIALSTAMNKVVYQRELWATPSQKGQLVIADQMEIPGGTGNVEVKAFSPVSNNWVELDAALVNDTTQDTDEFTLPVEYYYGTDSDGAWSEGAQNNSTLIPAVAGGNYHLQIAADAGSFAQQQPVALQVQVARDVPVWQNFWIAALLLMLYPFWVMIRSWRFEVRRWSNSDFAPFPYRQGEGE